MGEARDNRTWQPPSYLQMRSETMTSKLMQLTYLT